MRRVLVALCAVVVGGAVLVSASFAQSLAATTDDYGLVDPSTGVWHLYEGGVQTTQFYFGDPGDYPFVGDWDCNDIDTPGLYRQSDGYVYLRNSNTQGNADISFFFGNPGDVPIAGDFNADGCDTVSIYRPSNQTFYVINDLGTSDGGLGAAEYSYVFGNPGDKPFIGDFNGNGQGTPGLHRESTGLVYYRNTNTQGTADNTFIYGDPGDRFVAGDWTGNGVDSPGLFRPSNATMYLRYENSQGNADESWLVGSVGWLPVAGRFAVGAIAGTVTQQETGTPLGDIVVEVKNAGTGFFVAGDTTAPDGTYAVGGLDPGDYDVSFEDHSGVHVDGSVSDVTVNAGSATTVSVQLVRWAIANCRAQSSIPAAECEALVAFYDATDGPNWTKSAGWLTAFDPCSWHGVACSGGRVTHLGLVSSGLWGEIPSSLASLTNLAHLHLAHNGLSGEIPSSLASLTNLTHLHLGYNELSGEIPSALGGLINLNTLILASNELSGEIPDELGNLTDLTDLYLHSNGLSGEIPSALGGLINLDTLVLGSNALSGQVPSALEGLTNLTWLDLRSNGLSGPVPPELQNLTQLTHLWLRGQTRCLTASTPSLTAWLVGLDSLWNDGCPTP